MIHTLAQPIAVVGIIGSLSGSQKWRVRDHAALGQRNQCDESESTALEPE